MLGHSHALSGAAAGLGVGIALHLSHVDIAAVAAGTAGAALLPDLDSSGSCSARCLGPLSRLPSLLIRRISGGHRHATHSFLGVAAFGGLAWLACHFRHDLGGKIGLGFLVMLIVAGGLEALGVCADLTADLAGSAAACAVVFYGLGLTLVPLVVVAGCVTHLAGDALTESGVPLLYPAKARFRWWPRPLAFETGTRPERWIVDPVLLTAIGLLAVWTIAPGAELAVIHGL